MIAVPYKDHDERLRSARESHQRNPDIRRQWAARNPEKRRAQVAVGNAVRDGRLVRQPCEGCGAKPAQAHHDDYAKPLDVRWLCTRCHSDHHYGDMQRAA